MAKRVKTKNFTFAEKKLVLQLIESRKEVIESKVTSSKSIKEKNKAWNEVTDLFNVSAEVPRNIQQIKNLYENLKRRARKDITEDNKLQEKVFMDVKANERDDAFQIAIQDKKIEIFKSGGGKKDPGVMNEIGQQLLGILADKIVPLNNTCDSPRDYHNDICTVVYDEREQSDPVPQRDAEPRPDTESKPDPDPRIEPVPKPSPIIWRPVMNTRKKKPKLPSAEELKRMYFAQKLKNAQFEARAQRRLFILDLKIRKQALHDINNKK